MQESGQATDLLWSLDFDGASGAGPNPMLWNFDLGDGSDLGIPGWGNAEQEIYVTDAVRHDGRSNLVIAAHRTAAEGSLPNWTSGRLNTKGKLEVRYGRIEARLQLAKGAGAWPAFWMLATDIANSGWPKCGEIDIMEFRGDRPSTLFGTVHGPGYFAENGKGGALETEVDLSGGFHTYGVDWRPGRINWHFDGKEYASITAADVWPTEWVFDKPFYLLVNLAIGGHFAGAVDPTMQRAEFRIDYIRHYKLAGDGEWFADPAALQSTAGG